MVFWFFIGFAAFAALSAIFYFPKFLQYAGAFKKPARIVAKQKRRIALVIPARNESLTIGALLQSILLQDYDKNYFDVNVIVKDAGDETCAMARAVGAKVFVAEKQSCKGEALDGYFSALSEQELNEYDAFVIVDADAVLAPSYVSELNNALEYDRQIFVTRKYIKNYLGGKKSRSAVCGCAALVYPMIDEMGNLYRAQKGIPLNFCGQGLMVRREVIVRLGGWRYRSLTEDYELKMDGFLKDFTSMYYPYAEIYTEEVVKHKDSYLRRLRWLTGYSQCDIEYGARVKEKLKKQGGNLALKFDFLHYKKGILLYLIAVVVTMLAGGALAAYYACVNDKAWVLSLTLLVLLPVCFTYAILFLYGAMAMSFGKAVFITLPVREKIAILFLSPLFTLEFVPIFLCSRIGAKKSPAWRETERVKFR